MERNVIDEPTYRDKLFIFRDRLHAGELLADRLQKHVSGKLQVLAIPAGGVPVGYIVARELKAQLDVAVVRKVQFPWNPEAGFGAVAWDGTTILNEALIAQLGLSNELVQKCILKARENVKERIRKFRGDKPFPPLRDKVAVLVDDGLASGFTMLATVKALSRLNPEEIVVAVPTASTNAVDLVAPYVSKLICLNIRSGFFFAVADAYKNWYDVSDGEVLEILGKFSSMRCSG